MEDFSTLTAGERALLAALNRRGVRFLIVGLSAWISGVFGARPPQIGGDAIGDRLDVVTHMHGLEPFEDEYARAIDVHIDEIPVRVLPLERIVVSKRASGRPKDLAALPALEEALAALRTKV